MKKMILAAALVGMLFATDASAQQADGNSAQSENGQNIAQDTLEHNVKRVTTLEGAYFNSSCGKDRLGGSKMGFINKDIVLRVEDANEDLYKVLLSANRYAFMPKEMVADTLVEDIDALAVCASGSMNVANEGTYDRIKIGLPTRKPYIIRECANPRQLIIELFGVQNNSNWVTQYTDLKVVESVDLIQSDSDVLTIVVNLKSRSSWGYSAAYDGNNLIVKIKHTPALSLKGMTIGIDAGHGGPESNGAIARKSRKTEKELNLAMAYMLKQELEAKGAKVVLSRKDDSALTMSERKKIFLDNNIDLLISIHCNAAGGSAHGTSTYYKHIQNRELAKKILENLLEIDGVDLFGLVGNFNFSLNAPTEYPAVLVETLFLSYAPDEEKIINPKFQKEMMKKVREGIEDYLKHCRKLEK